MFKDIRDAREYLSVRNVSVFGLDSMNALDRRLGKPDEKLKFVHVTGTNGKGSTSSYIANILMESGYKVGTFSSPAVFENNEIIKINNVPISDTDFVECANEVLVAIEEMEKSGERLPTKFEIETAMSFVYFAREKVDIVIMEVGMGGELDATNIVDTTLVELITRISYDHMGVLGKTLKEIALSKTGIVKNNTTVITTGQDSEAMKVIKNKCLNTHSKLIVAGDGTRLIGDDEHQVIAYKGRDYSTQLLGYYQIYNLPIAVECAKELKRLGYTAINDNSIMNGIANTVLQGRFEIIGTNPTFIIDGAHNDEASNMLAEGLRDVYKDKKMIFLIGIFKDKAYGKIIENTIDLASEVITFDWTNPRALGGDVLRDTVKEHMDNVHYIPCIKDAVKRALEDSSKGDVIVAFGSLSHLSEIKDAYEGVKNGRY